MTVVIVDYGSGNLRSAAKAFERAASDCGVGIDVRVRGAPEDLADASHVVLPGVGAFSDCRRMLARGGLIESLRAFVDSGKPFLGICVGMQLMATRGREHGDHEGFDWIAGDVVPLAPEDPRRKVPPMAPEGSRYKIPHMGWNELDVAAPDHPLMEGITSGEHMYFVHGYHMRCDNPGDVLATTDHGTSVSAVLARDNRAGVQFHPEKSQAAGLRFITNFMRWRP